MELLKGATLREQLNLRKRFAPFRTIEIFRGICSAIGAAHRRNLIHRDLKPENIFLAENEDGGEEIVKLLDFGIAKSLAVTKDYDVTRIILDGIVVGTPASMSPEQVLGESPDVASDLWALAVVLYETLTGTRPFASSAQDFRQEILASRFIPLNAHLAIAHPGWETFFAECFALDRSKRPSSVAQFLKRLEATFT